jgi:hypothetical protein
MNQEQKTLTQIKSDIKALLESAIPAFEFAETVDSFNDNLFKGTMTLHDAKSLTRVIGDMKLNYAECSVIQSCLTRISNRCQILGMEVLAYEARTLSDRLAEQNADQGCVGPPVSRPPASVPSQSHLARDRADWIIPAR